MKGEQKLFRSSGMAVLSRLWMTVKDAVLGLGILIAINLIASQNNKAEMVVLSNQKQGKCNDHNEQQDLCGRWGSLTHSEI